MRCDELKLALREELARKVLKSLLYVGTVRLGLLIVCVLLFSEGSTGSVNSWDDGKTEGRSDGGSLSGEEGCWLISRLGGGSA